MKDLILDNDLIKIYFEEAEIVHGTFKVRYIDLNIAKDLVKMRLEATNEKDYLIIANIKSVKNITKEARDFFASEEGSRGIIATAFLVDSPIGVILGNFFININKPLRPAKLFSEEKKARNWLLKYK